MAYDGVLADRMRALLEARRDVTEKKMFGGLAFLVGGHMAIAASGEGGALVRVDPCRGRDHARPPDDRLAARRRPRPRRAGARRVGSSGYGVRSLAATEGLAAGHPSATGTASATAGEMSTRASASGE